jgi:hypothetical protein
MAVLPDLTRKAFYFGCIDSGHFLYDRDLITVREGQEYIPWATWLLDTGLLKNAKVPDVENGDVRWTTARGGWHVFSWWDRSGDKRPNSCSCFVVRGFDYTDHASARVAAQEAFLYACAQFPLILARQRHTLNVRL